jgi:cyclomaltodextrinase / maltogenic alpha-amylase / neopullulanase
LRFPNFLLRAKRINPARTLLALLAFPILFSLLDSPALSSVIIRTRDAVVWARSQVVTGSVDSTMAMTGTLYVNGVPVSLQVASPADTFAVPVLLQPGVNTIVARVDSAGGGRYSDTLRLTLGYSFAPEVYAWAAASGSSASMHVSVIDNPDTSVLAFSWMPDAHNPISLTMTSPSDSTASVTFPPGTPGGDYVFRLTVRSARGDTGYARAIVRFDSSGAHPFDISTDHARWIDSAVVYGVTPYIFVGAGQFADVTARIPEIVQLGVTAIWIQPVFSTHGGGQGYDIIDYFNVRTDVGGEAQLAALVSTAHAHGLRVLFDLPANHTSIYHPYAQDAVQYGPGSHYYGYYERSKDAAPYSSNENLRTSGLMTFVYYFWTDLVNLDYGNPEVQRMMTEASKYWIRKYDIDGYRVDASWGVSARTPSFFKQWRLALKRLKPEILLLAEDKASVRILDANNRVSPFDHEFDAAYDWTNEMSWVSHWVWESTYSANSNPTIFNNTPEAQRGAALHNALTSNGAGYAPGAIPFRFLENNDTYRFLATHDLARTKMAAALEYSLNGIPLLYNGQEIGNATYPYSAYFIFSRGGTMMSQDPYGLFPYYQQLARWRRNLPALTGPNFAEVPITPSASQYAFRRWSGSQNVFTCVNMAASAASATLAIPVPSLGLDSTRTYYLTDLISGQYVSGTPAALGSAGIQMPAYSTRMFLLADSIVSVTSVQPGALADLPGTYRLDQNYPNPFNPATVIGYELPAASHVRLEVYDVLGRSVATLVNAEQPPGRYTVPFDGRALASGMYVYRLQAGSRSIAKKMLIVK